MAEELVQRLHGIERLSPSSESSSGFRGHLWEQTALLGQTRNRKLWSPSTTGPIGHPNQIVTIHDIAFIDGPDWFSRSFRFVYDQILRKLTRTARHIITVSEFTRRRVLEHYGVADDRATTIYSGVAASFRPRPRAEVEAVLARLALPSEHYFVAFLGTDPRKNTETVMRAWETISRTYPEVHLVTFGRNSNTSVFAQMKLTAPVRNVFHVGPISDDDLACLYTQARGLIFPSLYEGFGLPVIEAAACGARVITSNGSALREVAPADAALVDPHSVGALIGAIDRAIQTPDTPGARAERSRRAGDFSWDRAASEYAAAFGRHFR